MRTGLQCILTMAILAGLTACGGGASGPDRDDAVVADGAEDATREDVDGGEDTQRSPTQVDEDFRLLLLRQDSEFTYSALVLANPGIPEWDDEADPMIGVAGDPLDEEGPKTVNPDIDCSGGCFTDPTMRWFAYVAQATNGGDGPRTHLVVGSLDDDLRFSPLGGVEPIPDVTDLAFAGDRLYVSQRIASCDAVVGLPKPCWVYRRLDLSSPGPLEPLFTFPTPEEILLSGHAGHFDVSADGTTVVLQDPRLGTLRLWVWRDDPSGGPGTLFLVGETICGTRLDEFDNCQATPGIFTDREPVAVSDDGSLIVLAAIENDEALRLFTVALPEDTETFTRSQLAYVTVSLTEGSFRADGYYNPMTAPFTRVQTGMRFVGADDAMELLFVGVRQAQNPKGKEDTRTDLAAIPMAALKDGNDEGLAPIRRITRFEAGNIPENVLIPEGGFDVSPGGAFVAFLGTPVLDSSGEPLTAEELQHEWDQEVFVTRLDGTTEPVQVTGHQPTRTWELRAVPTPGTGR